MAGPLYRVRQFLAAVRPRSLDAREQALVRRYLPNRAYELYRAMPVSDQRHSLTILTGLLEAGYTDRPLLQAALLHDVAKRDIGLWHRTAVILMNAVSQDLAPRVASPDPRSWRYPFYLSLNHPELGADAAARAGVDPRAVLLIRRHQSPPDVDGDLGRWQRALKALDDRH